MGKEESTHQDKPAISSLCPFKNGPLLMIVT